MLKQNGLSESDVTIVDMSPEDAAAAVVGGKVDVAVTWNPFLASAAEDPNVDILMTSKETPGLIADVVVMRNEVLETTPDACQRFARAWNRAVAFQEVHPDEGAAIMAEGLGYGTADDIKADLAGIVLQGKEGNAQFFGGDGAGTALGTARFAIELWTESGRLTSTVKAEDLIDTSCLEQ